MRGLNLLHGHSLTVSKQSRIFLGGVNSLQELITSDGLLLFVSVSKIYFFPLSLI